jgi:isopentenyldiphosphate isomerase
MSILVNTHNELEEKVLLAFLDSLKYDYKSGAAAQENGVSEAFLDQYNKELEEADKEIDAGHYVEHDDVVKLFANRRKNLNAD